LGLLNRAKALTVRAGSGVAPTLRYWMETEVHVYGFSIAANVLLALYPFLIVLISICRYVLHWDAAEDAIFYALQDFFPGGGSGIRGVGQFLRDNLDPKPVELLSIFLLLFTANGIFEPLEVALNRAWGIRKNRSFLRNQLVSMGLIFACGCLALLSVALTAFNRDLFASHTGVLGSANSAARVLFYKAAAVPVSILMLFLIYWLLPNRKISPKHVLPTAILVGIALEVLKYINLLTWPWLSAKLAREYGVFINSVAIILWSFLASMVVLAGAEWTSRRLGSPVKAAPPEYA
jgi:YihY family inner membrane protein